MPLLSPFQKLNQVQWGGPTPGWPDLEFGQDPEGLRYARTPQGVASWDPSQGSTPQPDPGVDIGPGTYPGTRRRVSYGLAAHFKDQENIQFLEDYKAKVAEASKRQAAAEADQQQKAGLRMVADLIQKNVKPDEATALAEMFAPGFQGPTTKRDIMQQEGRRELMMLQSMLGNRGGQASQPLPRSWENRVPAQVYQEVLEATGDPNQARAAAEEARVKTIQSGAFTRSEAGAIGGATGQLTLGPGGVPYKEAVSRAGKLGSLKGGLADDDIRLGKIEGIIKDLGALSSRLMTEPTGGLTTKAKGLGQWLSGKAGYDLVAEAYIDMRDSMLGPLARHVSEERGVLTDFDLARIRQALPAFGDAAPLRDYKIGRLKLVVQVEREAIHALANARDEVDFQAIFKQYDEKKEQLLNALEATPRIRGGGREAIELDIRRGK